MVLLSLLIKKNYYIVEFTASNNIMIYKTSFLILMVVITITACKKDNNNSVANTTDIYMSGAVTPTIDDERSGALYWKNGVPVNLPNPNPHNVGASVVTSAGALAIAINGSDVYVAGYGQEILHPNSLLYVAQDEAMFWKNGVVTKLSSSFSRANAIALNGNDIYLAGSVNQHAVYWKNGVAVNLPDSSYSSASGIAVIDSDVYVTGTITNKAIYWKNGTVHFLNGNYPSGITISGKDVYIVGSIRSSNQNNVATYWKNGVPVTFGDQSVTSGASAITVVGTDIYVVGASSSNTNSNVAPVYWKNGTVYSLPGSFGAGSIGVNGKDIYVGGTSDMFTTRFWKNAIPVDLNPSNGSVSGIAIVSH
jgi:hypothetical protein